MTTTWRKELKEACKCTKDNFESLITTLSEEELDVFFNAGYGGYEGIAFTAWSKNYVYFPEGYDGAEAVVWVPRHPCNIKVEHIGGGG